MHYEQAKMELQSPPAKLSVSGIVIEFAVFAAVAGVLLWLV